MTQFAAPRAASSLREKHNTVPALTICSPTAYLHARRIPLYSQRYLIPYPSPLALVQCTAAFTTSPSGAKGNSPYEPATTAAYAPITVDFRSTTVGTLPHGTRSRLRVQQVGAAAAGAEEITYTREIVDLSKA